ncbi:MAG: hypothetical protein ACM33B_15640, partial [Pseudomonadota bacterium]
QLGEVALGGQYACRPDEPESDVPPELLGDLLVDARGADGTERDACARRHRDGSARRDGAARASFGAFICR